MHLVTARASIGLLCLLSATALHAQQTPSSTGTVPRLVRVSSSFSPANGLPAAPVETVTLAIYAEETGGTPLWQETQYVVVDADGRYTVLLGATLTEGLPLELFASGEARWLARRFERPGEGEQARVLLASVPYALKASDADTLGGQPASAYLRAEPASTSATPEAAGRAPTSKNSTQAVSSNTMGTTGYLGMFVDSANLGNSALFQNGGGSIGLGTTAPADVFHVAFTNGSGTQTGYAVQNLSSAAGAYSGMLFYDQNGALGQFQGFNNSTHEYRINNIASGGSINFMIGSSSKFLVANNGNVTVNGNIGAKKLSAQGNASFVASGTVSVSSTSSTVTGTGTAFLTELQVGDRLQVGAEARPVTAIASNTSLTLSGPFFADAAGTATIFPPSSD